MARGRHYAKLSLSNAARLSFSDLCILLFMFLSLCRLCVCVFLCSHWSLVDVPLIFFCPADHVPDWQPRVLLGMVEARSVNVKKTTTTTVVAVVVVDSHIQRIVLATEETTVTQQVSPRPIKCQSRLWSQRGTKVNGSHHGDNPLLRPTGIQIATKSYAALQAMAPTNIKTVHQTSLLHIESNLDRLGMLSPTHDQRSQQKTGKITLQPVLINKSKFLKATHFVQK